MTRLLRNQLQNHVAQIARAKKSHWPATPASESLSESMPPAAKLSSAAAMSMFPVSLSMAFFFAMKTSEICELFFFVSHRPNYIKIYLDMSRTIQILIGHPYILSKSNETNSPRSCAHPRRSGPYLLWQAMDDHALRPHHRRARRLR